MHYFAIDVDHFKSFIHFQADNIESSTKFQSKSEEWPQRYAVNNLESDPGHVTCVQLKVLVAILLLALRLLLRSW